MIQERKPYALTYKNVLEDAGIKAEETLFIDDSIKNIKIQKGEIIINIDERSDSIYFIKTGLLRGYYFIDGKESKVSRFDGYCTWYRLGMEVVADNLDEGNHTAEITVIDGGIDKKGIIFKENVSEIAAHPEEYEETNWYVGNILTIDK